MDLQCTIQDGVIWLSDRNERIEVNPAIVKSQIRPE
jgi:uncharacterized protein YaeQ